LNSYDLGVDIELHDALQRIRFETSRGSFGDHHSAKNRIFCSGANIYMLGLSSHAWKVNSANSRMKRRNGIEDASAHSGLKFLAACKWHDRRSGYELALACDEIILVDDGRRRSVCRKLPLLGVLPGTGGLTRVTDKRKVRRDSCRRVLHQSGWRSRSKERKEWRLVDDVVKPQQFAEAHQTACVETGRGERSPRRGRRRGFDTLRERPMNRGCTMNTSMCSAIVKPALRQSTCGRQNLSLKDTLEKALAAGGEIGGRCKMARELDDAILTLARRRTGFGALDFPRLPETLTPFFAPNDDRIQMGLNHQDIGSSRKFGMMRRTFARIDVTSRSIYSIVEPGSSFAGTLLELGWLRRSYISRHHRKTETPLSMSHK